MIHIQNILLKRKWINLQKLLVGNYTGIGVYIASDITRKHIIVLAPIKNSPAYEAGILSGDVILKVNNIEYTGEQLTLASQNIKGEEGTTVDLEIQRDEEIINLSVKRTNIDLNQFESKVINKNIGYISFLSFEEGCSEKFLSEYTKLKEQGIKSLIIDLRNNGGGIVQESLAIANYIVENDKTLLITVDKNNKEEVTTSKLSTLIENIPIVVISNENTASASEILIGALKDNKKATIVGNTTFGKGVIQQVFKLPDGDGIKITTNEYYTPNKIKINEIGIEPDIKVELPEDVDNIYELSTKDDIQLQKAIEVLKK